MLSDSDAACVANTLALCLKKERDNSPLDQRMVKTKTAIHKNLTTDGRLSDPNECIFICSLLDGQSCAELLAIVTRTISKRNTC
jgi:hypothetical protein